MYVQRSLVWILVFVLCASAGGVGIAQTGAYEDVTDVVVIEVPVQVTKGGQPVRGLTKDNFELIVDGKKRKLLSFDVVDLSLLESNTPSAAVTVDRIPVVARRHFLLLFDLSFASPDGILRAQQAAQGLVLDGLHPTDMVGVATYAESRNAEIVLSFTSDRQQIDLALATLGQIDPAARLQDPLGIMLADYRDYVGTYGTQDDAMRAQNNPQGLNLALNQQWLWNLKDYESMSGRANRDQIKNQILNMTSSLTEMADHLAAVGGSKNVVLFSEGFDSSSLVGTDDPIAQQEIRADADYGQYWRVDSEERFGDKATQIGVFDMLDHFNRCDCTIQAVDVGGARALGSATDARPGTEAHRRATGEESLFVMANETGGNLYRNYNDLTGAMDAMLAQTSLTYLLAWQPEDPGVPGEFYPIRVKLKDAPKGARLTHRPGYYAPKPYAAMHPTERRLHTAELLMDGREGGALDTSVLAAPYWGMDQESYLLTFVEVEGYSALRGNKGEVLPMELFAYAIDGNGSVAGFLTQAVAIDLNKQRTQLDSRGFKFYGHLDLDPGDYEIRVLVRNALTGATGLRVAEVTVPNFGGDQPALLPPLFLEASGTWLMTQENREAADQRAYPLTSGNEMLVPSAKPILKAGQDIPVLLVGHNLDAGELQASSQLVPIDGKEVVAAQLTLKQRRGSNSPNFENLIGLVNPGQAPPGDYRLEVTLTEQATGREISSAIPVKVF